MLALGANCMVAAPSKTPRIYWRDSGLLHALTNVADLDGLYRQPWLGQSWKGFDIEQALSTLMASGRREQAFYFRTSDGHELDRLNATADLIDATRRFLVCRIASKIETDRLLVTHLSGWLRQLAA
jgi:hypothetical protein